MEAARRRHPAGRDRRPQCRARQGVPRRRGRRRLRRHRHHAQRGSRRPRPRVDRRDARTVTPIALTIAVSDSGGGAGIQADLKTFAALGVYAATAITALTAQNTRGVRAIHLVPPEIVVAQVLAVTADFQVAAIKIGMLGSTGIVWAVARVVTHPRGSPKRFIVFDPVMFASSGDKLSGGGFVEAIRVHLLPIVDCLTPNLA